LYRALCAARQRFAEGKFSLKGLQSAMADVIGEVPEFAVDYATAVSAEGYAETDPVADTARLIIAGKLGSVRLIDNMRLK
jgi:pantothenate synthetase